MRVTRTCRVVACGLCVVRVTGTSRVVRVTGTSRVVSCGLVVVCVTGSSRVVRVTGTSRVVWTLCSACDRHIWCRVDSVPRYCYPYHVYTNSTTIANRITSTLTATLLLSVSRLH